MVCCVRPRSHNQARDAKKFQGGARPPRPPHAGRIMRPVGCPHNSHGNTIFASTGPHPGVDAACRDPFRQLTGEFADCRHAGRLKPARMSVSIRAARVGDASSAAPSAV